MVQVWRSEENLQKLIFSFCHLDSKNQSQAITLTAQAFTHLVILLATQLLFMSAM